MASRVVTQLISDLSGQDIPDGKGETVEFAYRGISYTIDLTKKEAAEFDQSMALYLERASRKSRTGRTTRRGKSATNDARAIRVWARDNGIDVPDRGRIPADVRARFEAEG